MKAEGVAATAAVAMMLWAAAGETRAAVQVDAKTVGTPADVTLALATSVDLDRRVPAQAPMAWKPSQPVDDPASIPTSRQMALLAAGIGVLVFLARRRLGD